MIESLRKIRWHVAALLVLLIQQTSALAALPDLPSEAMGDDVVGVLWLDAQQLDAASFTQTITSVMGRYAKPANEALTPFTRLHAPFIRAGGTSMAIVYFDPHSANAATRGVANPVYLFSMAPNANRAAIESIIEQVSLDDKNKPQAKIEVLGQWLLAYDGRLARPYMEKGTAERMETLRSALDPIGKHPAALAFVPTLRMRRAHADRIGVEPSTPREMLLFVESLLECRSLSLAATAGPQPTLNAVLKMPDTESGAELIDMKKPLMEKLTTFMRKPDMRGVKIELITQLATYHAVLSNINLQIDRSQITATATGPILTQTAEGIANGLAVARDEALIVRSLNHMKALIVALNSYAADNRGRYPAKLEDLQTNSYVKNLSALLVNPITGQSPGYIYVAPAVPLSDLVKQKRTDTTPILYESKDGRLNPRGLIGYVNTRIQRPDLQE